MKGDCEEGKNKQRGLWQTKATQSRTKLTH